MQITLVQSSNSTFQRIWDFLYYFIRETVDHLLKFQHTNGKAEDFTKIIFQIHMLLILDKP